MACFGVPFNAMFSVYSPFLDIERVSTGARGGDAKEYRRRIKYARKRIIWQKVFLYINRTPLPIQALILVDRKSFEH